MARIQSGTLFWHAQQTGEESTDKTARTVTVGQLLMKDCWNVGRTS